MDGVPFITVHAPEEITLLPHYTNTTVVFVICTILMTRGSVIFQGLVLESEYLFQCKF